MVISMLNDLTKVLQVYGRFTLKRSVHIDTRLSVTPNGYDLSVVTITQITLCIPSGVTLIYYLCNQRDG